MVLPRDCCYPALYSGAAEESTEIVIRAAYKQVFGNVHLMDSTRSLTAKSKLKERGILSLEKRQTSKFWRALIFKMLNLSILVAATSTPDTLSWTPVVGIVMIICNILAIALGKYTLPNPGVGTALPMPEMFGGMGWPALLATTSLGHIFGILAIFGLSSYGLL